MARTIQAVADWVLPTGQFAAPGGPVVGGQDANREYSTPYTWARFLLNYYELCKPPLVNDRWKALGGAGNGAAATMAEYVLPGSMIGGEFTGAGTTIEGLVVDAYGHVNGGDTATVYAVTPDGSDSATFASASDAWFQPANKVDVIDYAHTSSGYRSQATAAHSDFLLRIRGQATTGTNLVLLALHVRWWRESTTLPGGRYGNDFVPPDLVDWDTDGDALTVHQMRRMIADLITLKRRRSAAMILTSYLPVAVGGKAAGDPSNCAFRAPLWQPERVESARVWVKNEGTNIASEYAVRFGGQAKTIAFAGAGWQHVDFTVAPHDWETPQNIGELRVVKTSGAAGAKIRGCCAWWQPIEGVL